MNKIRHLNFCNLRKLVVDNSPLNVTVGWELQRAERLLPCPQVNGLSVVHMQHSEVVAAIKAGGAETKLLVVDAETEEFFKRCNVLPTEEHVTGKKTSRGAGLVAQPGNLWPLP